MIRRDFLLIGAAVTSTLFAGDEKGSKLVVHVSYTGSGTVDESHKVYVALWGAPDFAKPDASNMMPMSIKSVASKSADASFDDITKSPVYVSLAYDPSGKWDAQSDPPVGTCLAMHGKEGVPAPIAIEPGKTAKVSITLDDSFKKS